MQILKSVILLVILSLNVIESSANDINFCGERIPLTDKQVLSNFSVIAKKMNNKYNLQAAIICAQNYFPYVSSVLSQYGIPDDFKYLAFVETGYKNHYSTPEAGAGVWAIMPTTAKMFDGLTINTSLGIDERLDFPKATHFAAKLIVWLYNRLGSWTLTAAAYNGGIGRISSKIRMEGHKNYYRMRLCKETADYVLKIICIKAMMESPKTLKYIQSGEFKYNSSTKDYDGMVNQLSEDFQVEGKKEKVDELFNSVVFKKISVASSSNLVKEKRKTLEFLGIVNNSISLREEDGKIIIGVLVKEKGNVFAIIKENGESYKSAFDFLLSPGVLIEFRLVNSD